MCIGNKKKTKHVSQEEKQKEKKQKLQLRKEADHPTTKTVSSQPSCTKKNSAPIPLRTACSLATVSRPPSSTQKISTVQTATTAVWTGSKQLTQWPHVRRNRDDVHQISTTQCTGKENEKKAPRDSHDSWNKQEDFTDGTLDEVPEEMPSYCAEHEAQFYKKVAEVKQVTEERRKHLEREWNGG